MKKEILLFFLIIFLAFAFRLYKIDSPVADWHSWRQADTSAVSRNFVKFGFDLLHPRFDDLSNVASGRENPQGYRFVEFPIYNLIHAILAKTFPVLSLEIWGRLTSNLFSLVSLIFLFLIVKKYLGIKTALLASLFFAVLPFNIYYSRVILPEPMMVSLSLGTIYFFDRWLDRLDKNRKLPYLFSLVFAASAILVKPYAIFLFLPMAYLAWRAFGLSSLKKPSLYLYIVLSLTPFILWRWWISHFPEGVPAFWWLLNGDGIRFKGAFFWWIFAERLGRLILGVWGLPLFLFGILIRPGKKEGWFFHWWLIAILMYLIIIATGNVRHDYYQILTVPIICIFLGKGANFLITEGRKIFNFTICYLLFAICILFMLSFSWYQVRDFFNINHPEIVEAGKVADRLVPKEAKVIAPYGGDTAFLYQINRQGWPIGFEIEKKIKMGAGYYVTVNFDDEVKDLEKKYEVVKKTDKYEIIKLRP